MQLTTSIISILDPNNDAFAELKDLHSTSSRMFDFARPGNVRTVRF
jgi:hypothetical protein